MNNPLSSRAAAAASAVRALERAFTDARAHWDDSVRRTFDQRYADPLLAEAKHISSELEEQARALGAALRELP